EHAKNYAHPPLLDLSSRYLASALLDFLFYFLHDHLLPFYRNINRGTYI
ncbi:unnamed protein product, partial [Amoebophrya sp. A25]